MPATTNLSFAKVVATPTSTSWSQAYNAASLFTVLSLTTDDEDLQSELPTHGKQILNNIQAEFFVLEDKSYEKVGEAITQTIKDLPEAITLSLTLTYIKEDTLYGFIIGSGRITLKRGEQVGTVLSKQPEPVSREMVSASGYLQTDDLILLQTTQFAQTVPASLIEQAFEGTLPTDIAETITPHIHGGDEGGASAVIIAYKGGPKVQEDDDFDNDTTDVPSPIEETDLVRSVPIINHRPQITADNSEERTTTSPSTRLKAILSKFPVPQVLLDKRKKPILGLALLLFGILLVSIFFVRTNQQSSQNHALFVEIYNSAKKDFDEGEGLLSLNKSLARDDYLSAKQTLDKAAGKFKEGSDDARKIAELTELVENRLSETEGVSKATVKDATAEDVPSLAAMQKENAIAVTEDEDALYLLSKTSVTKITKATDKKEVIIKNDGDWAKAVGIGVFSGNIYLLDQEEGLMKYVPTADGYTQSTYFKGEEPDLNKALSLAIDSSIYILTSDKKVTKYTRGTEDTFALSGLSSQLVAPRALYTMPDLANLYILDTGASRIVKVDTTGKFQAEFQAPILKNAKAFTIASDESTAYILADDKLAKLSLN